MFKVGDIVRVRKGLVGNKWYGDVMFQSHMKRLCGKKMEVKAILSGDYICYSDKFKETRCLTSEMLEPTSKAKEYRLIVTDKKVIILDKENKKKGISECHKDDTFQFEVGAKLAWDRLHGIEETSKVEENKLYDCNGVELKEWDEVYCVNLDDGYTDTRRIEFINGILCNSGFVMSHRADRNNGRYDSKYTLYRWKILKKGE